VSRVQFGVGRVSGIHFRVGRVSVREEHTLMRRGEVWVGVVDAASASVERSRGMCYGGMHLCSAYPWDPSCKADSI